MLCVELFEGCAGGVVLAIPGLGRHASRLQESSPRGLPGRGHLLGRGPSQRMRWSAGVQRRARPLCECGQIAYYALRGERPKYCRVCMDPDMVAVGSGLHICDCGKQAIYGFHNDGAAVCCAKCKADGTEDLLNTRCPCGRSTSFGLPADSRPTCCSKCKLAGMFIIKSPRCGCGRWASHALPQALKGTHCKACSSPRMSSVRSGRCEACSKARRPLFGMLEDGRPSVCEACKTHGMIDFRRLKRSEQAA